MRDAAEWLASIGLGEYAQRFAEHGIELSTVRDLTVMFCDLVGSTALSARLDPEDMRTLIGEYHSCITEVINRYQGIIARYMGDGVLVYFGYPQAHEDDAEQAVRAGLALVDAIAKLPTNAN